MIWGLIFSVICFSVLLTLIHAQAPINGGEHLWDAKSYYSSAEFVILEGINFQDFLDCYKTYSVALQDVLVEEPDDLTDPGEYEAGLNFDVWSPFVEEFNFYNELQLEHDPEIRKYHEELFADPHYDTLRYIVPIWLASVIIMHISHTFYYIMIGVFLGAGLMCMLPRIHPSIHDYGRRLVISWMVTWRKRMKYPDPNAYQEVYRYVFYRVPQFFREHTSESEPEPIRNLLRPWKTFEHEYQDPFTLTGLNMNDLKDLNEEELASLFYIDETLDIRHLLTREELESKLGTYIGEYMERDHRRSAKNYRKIREEQELAEELTRLQVDLTRIRFDEQNPKQTRKNLKPKYYSETDSESTDTEDTIQSKRSVTKLPGKRSERNLSIPAIPPPRKNKPRKQRITNPHKLKNYH